MKPLPNKIRVYLASMAHIFAIFERRPTTEGVRCEVIVQRILQTLTVPSMMSSRTCLNSITLYSLGESLQWSRSYIVHLLVFSYCISYYLETVLFSNV